MSKISEAGRLTTPVRNGEDKSSVNKAQGTGTKEEILSSKTENSKTEKTPIFDVFSKSEEGGKPQAGMYQVSRDENGRQVIIFSDPDKVQNPDNATDDSQENIIPNDPQTEKPSAAETTEENKMEDTAKEQPELKEKEKEDKRETEVYYRCKLLCKEKHWHTSACPAIITRLTRPVEDK